MVFWGPIFKSGKPSFTPRFLEKRIENGLDLHELAVLAGLLEHKAPKVGSVIGYL